jgi:hypothetical protein
MIDRKLREQEDAGVAEALRMLLEAWPNGKRFSARDAVPLIERGSLGAVLRRAGLKIQPDPAHSPEYAVIWQLRTLLNRLMLVDKTVLVLRAGGSGQATRFYVEALATVGMPAAEDGDARDALLEHWRAVVEGLTLDELAELPEPVLALLDFIAGLEEPRISRDQPDGLAEALNAQLPP